MKKLILFMSSMVSFSCFMNGMDTDQGLSKKFSKKEKADKKPIPHLSFRMNSPKTPKTPKSPTSVGSSARKKSVENGAVIPKIGTSESLKLALEQQREKVELQKLQEISPGRNT